MVSPDNDEEYQPAPTRPPSLAGFRRRRGVRASKKGHVAMTWPFEFLVGRTGIEPVAPAV